MNTIQQTHILLVDDNTDLLRLLEEQLRGAGYQNIRTVQNCAAAQTAFAAEMPELMILDINLPDGDGFSLFRTLRAKADVPTLFLSARDADANRKVGQYSLGMKQRLGIAMALLGSPKLLILDEPTNGLDPAGIQEMRSLISSMPETTGATVLISSHLLGEIEQMVTQVGILNHGKMLFEGSLQALQKHSRGGILLRVLDVPKSIAVLNRQGIRAVTQAQHPDVLELPALPDEALAALVCTLAESGVGVVGLTAQTKNLEEIFLSLTQNSGEVA